MVASDCVIVGGVSGTSRRWSAGLMSSFRQVFNKDVDGGAGLTGLGTAEEEEVLFADGGGSNFVFNRIASCQKTIKFRRLRRHCKVLHFALCHLILLGITGFPCLGLAWCMVDSHLFQWFACAGFVDAMCPASNECHRALRENV